MQLFLLVAMAVAVAGASLSTVRMMDDGYRVGGLALMAAAILGLGLALAQFITEGAALLDGGALVLQLAAAISVLFLPAVAWIEWRAANSRRPAPRPAESPQAASSRRSLSIDETGRLALARERFEDFALHSSAGLWIQDVASGSLVWVNPTFERIWGRSAAELYADPQSRLAGVKEEDMPRVTQALARAAEGDDFAQEYRLTRPDGNVVWVWDRAIPVRDTRGVVVSLAGFAEDITRRKGIEEVNLFRANFVANMSHEVRTPLNIIIGYLEFLLDGTFGDLTPQQAEITTRIRGNAEELLDLMSASLDLSRLDNHAIPLAIEAVDAKALIGDLMADARTLVEDRTIDLQWEVPPGTPHLLTDPQKLKMILKNLVSNAAKFTSTGRIEVTARAAEGGVEFAVLDTGPGIAPHLLPRVFEPFRQGQAAEGQSRGVGLGLYIVRRLVDILEGRIAVESTVGRGTVFRVWLPLVLDAELDWQDAPRS